MLNSWGWIPTFLIKGQLFCGPSLPVFFSPSTLLTRAPLPKTSVSILSSFFLSPKHLLPARWGGISMPWDVLRVGGLPEFSMIRGRGRKGGGRHQHLLEYQVASLRKLHRNPPRWIVLLCWPTEMSPKHCLEDHQSFLWHLTKDESQPMLLC